MKTDFNVILKTIFIQTDMEYIGLWITRQGEIPINSKFNEMNNKHPPRDKFIIQTFIISVN